MSVAAKRAARMPTLTAPTVHVNANSRPEWKNAMKAVSTAKVADPSSPTTGLVWMKQATAMHTVPSTTHSCASILVGHQLLSHS